MKEAVVGSCEDVDARDVRAGSSAGTGTVEGTGFGSRVREETVYQEITPISDIV